MGHLDVQCLASTVEVCCSWGSISEALSAVRCFTSKTFYVAYIVEALSQCVIHLAKLCQASCCAGTVFVERGEKPTPSTTGDGRERSRSMRRLCAKCAQCSLSMSQSAFPRDLWRVHQIQPSVLRDLKARTLTGLEGCTCLSLVLWELVVYLKA